MEGSAKGGRQETGLHSETSFLDDGISFVILACQIVKFSGIASRYCMVTVLSCIDIIEVIPGDWRDTGAVLEQIKI